MVLALLEGRKTQFCEPILPPPTLTYPQNRTWAENTGRANRWSWFYEESNYPRCTVYDRDRDHQFVSDCPNGQPGDRLWVRETHWINTNEHLAAYAADHAGKMPAHMKGIKWRSPVTMPRWASRLTLEITSIKVDRVQNISNNDALAEGIHDLRTHENNWDMRDCFKSLWDRFHPERNLLWAANPWIWVVEFKKI